MPTYEYRCANGHTVEIFQRMSEDPLSVCPKCKAKTRRVIHGGMGVIFKGSGFYTTDYRKNSAIAGGNGGSKSGECKPQEKPKQSAPEKTPAP